MFDQRGREASFIGDPGLLGEGVNGMKGEHVELLTGVLIGSVIGGMYAEHLATYVPLLVVILAVVFGLKFLGLR